MKIGKQELIPITRQVLSTTFYLSILWGLAMYVSFLFSLEGGEKSAVENQVPFFVLMFCNILGILMVNNRLKNFPELNNISVAFALPIFAWAIYYNIKVSSISMPNVGKAVKSFGDIVPLLFSSLNNLFCLLFTFPILASYFLPKVYGIIRSRFSWIWFVLCISLFILSLWPIVLGNFTQIPQNAVNNNFFEVSTSLLVCCISFLVFGNAIKGAGFSVTTLFLVYVTTAITSQVIHFKGYDVKLHAISLTFITSSLLIYWVIIKTIKERRIEEQLAALNYATNGIYICNYAGDIIWGNKRTGIVDADKVNIKDISSVPQSKVSEFLQYAIENGASKYFSTDRTEPERKLKTTINSINHVPDRLVIVDSDVSDMIDKINYFAHDVKNPLVHVQRLISGVSTSWLKDSNPTVYSQLQLINFSAISALNQISTYQKLYTKDMSDKENWETYNLYSVVLEISDSLAPLCKSDNINFYVDASVENLPSMFGDRDATRVFLSNIIINSVNAMLEKGTDFPKEISLTAEETENTYIVKVKDNGIGMYEDQLKNRNEFLLNKDITNSEEVGLGLKIIRKFVGDLNGWVEFIYSDEEGGTLMNINLPKKQFKI